MNLPNKLTLFRIILIPFFILCINLNTELGMLFSLAIFLVASLTDQLDGYIARKYNLITDFGKFADPLADKLLVLSAFISFIELGVVESYLVFIIIFREFLITGIRLVLAKGGEVVSANSLGKIKTITQILSIIFILLSIYMNYLFVNNSFNNVSVVTFIIGKILFYFCVVLTVLSGLHYIKVNMKNLKEAFR